MPTPIVTEHQLSAIGPAIEVLRLMVRQATRESKAGYYMQSVSVSAIEKAQKVLAQLDSVELATSEEEAQQ